MPNEFGTTEYENDRRYLNEEAAKEGLAEKPNPAPEEFHDYSGQTEEKGKKKRRSSLLRSLSALAVTAVAAVTVLPIFPSLMRKKAEAQIELSATDGVLEYVVSLKDWEENDVSVLVLTAGGYVLSEQPAEEETVSGSVEGLKTGYQYEVAVKSRGRTLTSRAVTMEASPPPAVKRTVFLGITHECTCSLDGMFHFTLSLVDENGYWSNYRATLEDAFGNRAECDFSEAPTKEHTLSVVGAGLIGNRAAFRVVCTTTEPNEEGNTEAREYVLYEREVTI